MRRHTESRESGAMWATRVKIKRDQHNLDRSSRVQEGTQAAAHTRAAIPISARTETNKGKNMYQSSKILLVAKYALRRYNIVSGKKKKKDQKPISKTVEKKVAIDSQAMTKEKREFRKYKRRDFQEHMAFGSSEPLTASTPHSLTIRLKSRTTLSGTRSHSSEREYISCPPFKLGLFCAALFRIAV